MEALPVALSRVPVVDRPTLGEDESVMHARIPLDAGVGPHRPQVLFQSVDHVRGCVLVELGAGEVQLGPARWTSAAGDSGPNSRTPWTDAAALIRSGNALATAPASDAWGTA
jgi:hypothetical protein